MRTYVSTPNGAGIIHVADQSLTPWCAQTNATHTEQWQSEIGPATCRRCLRLLQVIEEANGLPIAGPEVPS